MIIFIHLAFSEVACLPYSCKFETNILFGNSPSVGVLGSLVYALLSSNPERSR